jgi:transposase
MMPKPLQVMLSQTERTELETVRDKAAKAYLRERASAILKIADGLSASQVARHGLLKRRQYQTVCDWVRCYQAKGIRGLTIRQGRGRKAAFSP